MISVIIPTYNREKTITDSIRSVLTQTYSNIELIVVDDGSTDATESVVKSIHDERLFYYKQKNQGACVARNFGISLAHGEYIAFQDSDDLWMPNKLKRQYSYIVKKEADLVYCGMNRIIKGKKIYIPEKQSPKDKVTLEMLLFHNRISTQTILAKRKVFNNTKFDPSFRRLQDWDFVLQVAIAGYNIAYLPEALVSSEVKEDSITTKISSETAYLHLIEKYNKEYSLNKRALANIYSIIAYRYKKVDERKKKYYLQMSLKTCPNPKTLIKLSCSYIGLY